MRVPTRNTAPAPSAAAPWVRTRLRTAPGAAVALALLVVVTSFLAAVFPRAVDAYGSEGLRHDIRTASPHISVLELASPSPGLEIPQADRETGLRPETLTRAHQALVKALPAPLRVDPAQSTHGVRSSDGLEASDAWLPKPDGLPPLFTLAAQADLGDHSTVRDGRLPAARGPVTQETTRVEAAATPATAKSLHLRVGSVIHVPGNIHGPVAVRITGIVTPRQPGGAYWSVEQVLSTPSLTVKSTSDPRTYWKAGLLIAPEAAPALLGVRGGPELYWRLAPDPTALTWKDVPRLESGLASVDGGPGLIKLRAVAGGPSQLSLTTDLDTVISSYSAMRSAVTPIVAVAAFGIGAVAVVVLTMSGGLIAARRRSELALLRSRGGSLRGIGGRLLAETAVVAVPSTALGLLLAVLAVGEARLLPALLAACAVAALACAALPVRAVVAHRGTQAAGGREDLIGAKPSRRRTVAELTVLVLAVGAVVALRRRGTGSGGEADVLVSSAPVLVGLIAALVLGRLYPLPLRLLARPAGRLRGAVGFVALSRAGRSSATGALPLLALLVALTTTAFGGSVLAGIGDARDQAALLATGADARVAGATDAMELPRAAVEAVRRGTGVRDVAPVRIEHGVTLPGTGAGNTPNVTLIGADPASYARLAARTGLGAFSEGLLAPKGTGGTGGSGGTVPAVASPAVAARLGGVGGGPHPVSALSGRLSVRIVAVEPRTPGAPDSGYLLVDADALTKRAPTTLLITGDGLDAGALRKAAPGFTVKLRSEARSVYLDSPLQSGAERIYAAAIAAGAGYAVLALLLSLLQSAPERTTLLVRLRTMGLTGKQGRRLLELEALPPALLAAVGGALVGWATIALLAPGVDLTRLALSAAPGSDPTGSLAAFGTVTLRTDPWSLLVPGAGVLALAAAVALVQAWWAGCRGSINEPRE